MVVGAGGLLCLYAGVWRLVVAVKTETDSFWWLVEFASHVREVDSW